MARNAKATGNSEPDPARDEGAYLAAVRKGMASYRTRPVEVYIWKMDGHRIPTGNPSSDPRAEVILHLRLD